ncbi:hypothetical protein ACLOJK_029574 [Asimina triloba]
MHKYNQFGVLPEHQKSGAPSSPNGSHGGQNPFRSEEPLLLLQLAQISIPAALFGHDQVGRGPLQQRRVDLASGSMKSGSRSSVAHPPRSDGIRTNQQHDGSCTSRQ